MVVGGSPYGPKASLNLRIEEMLTGSEPLIRPATLLRSSSSPSLGRPRSAASSNAKFGAAAKVRPRCPSAASSLIHRPGRRTNDTGDIRVMRPPHSGNRIISRPMSWYSGSQLTLRMLSSRPTEMIICRTLVITARCVISTPAGTRVDPDVYCR
ncbi:Uncharacterised protein [Mycobacteroides abscessus subsp. abscessus]|nr:Uncharacterised protein [Mycobacteroides abscessus subsp. abscessus]SHZ65903.1 Uncharacterised protein [Mycobacteroides abscessus subsp. abscessus]SKR84362.1 Uncharacterised protein [Mycobacteroides abscessus subsp. abscessus]SKW27475.1 Uncharacterised protein [Mycobacteroides abscessus subsp. abscessus]SKX26072.1 Uncharacterised protein [Mycobacteroides abscessus subsp. abscessus]